MSDSFRYALDAAVDHFIPESEFARKKPAAGQKGFDFGDDEPPAAPVASGSGGFDEHKVNREHEAHDGKRPGEFAPKETPEAKPEESEAEGPLWYGMKHRPPAPGAIPKGNYEHKAHPDFRHGQINYGRPLTEDEQRSYELSPIHEDTHLPALAKRVGAEMGEHAPEYAKPENDDILNDRLSHEDIRKMGHFDKEKLKAAIRSQFGGKVEEKSPQDMTADELLEHTDGFDQPMEVMRARGRLAAIKMMVDNQKEDMAKGKSFRQMYPPDGYRYDTLEGAEAAVGRYRDDLAKAVESSEAENPVTAQFPSLADDLPKEEPKPAESQNPGAIYETRVRGGDGKPVTMYGVASRPNGEPGFGDSVFRTREEAQSHSVKKAELDKANSEFLAKQNAVKEKEAAKEAAEKSEREDINGFSEDASPRDKANIIKTLSKKASFDGKVMSLKEKVRELVENGESPSTHETNKIQPMTRTQFNRADQKQQDAHEKKMREAGMKTVYRVGGYDLGKTAHDYAKHLISQKSTAAAVAEQFPSLKDDIKPIAGKPKSPSLNPKGEGLPFDIEAAHVGMGKRGYAQYGDHKVKVAPHADSGTGSDMKYAVEHYLSDGKGGANRTILPERHDSIEAAQNAAVNHLASKVNGEVKPQDNASFGERFQKHKESGKSDLDATLHSLAEHLQAKGSKITADQLNRNWYNHHITGLNRKSTDDNVKTAIEASVDTKPSHDEWWMDQKPTGGPQSHGAAMQDQSIEKRRKELLEHADHIDAQADVLRAAGSPEKADAMAKKSQMIRDKVATNRGWYQSAIKDEQASKKAEEDAMAEKRRWKNEPTPAKAMTEKAMVKSTDSARFHPFAKMLDEHGWYTNGAMAMKPPEKMRAKLKAEYGKYDQDVDTKPLRGMLDGLLNQAGSANGPAMKAVGSRTIPGDLKKKEPETHTILMVGDDDHHILDAKLVQTFLKAYPRATFHSTGGDSDMVAVRNGGEVVGMLMGRSEGSSRHSSQWAKDTADHVKRIRDSGKLSEFSRADQGCRSNLIAAIHSCLNQDGKHKADESVDTQIPEDPAQLDPHVAQVLQALAGQDPDVKEALGEYLASCAG